MENRAELADFAWSPVRRGLCGLALALLFGYLSLGTLSLLSPTFDETSHLPSGYSYWKSGEVKLNPQHPPLLKWIAAAPLLAIQPEIDLNDPAYTAATPDEWSFGYRFLYGPQHEQILFWGRVPMALLGFMVVVYTGLWARRRYGETAGWIAASLAVFSPTLAAHARFVTFDVGLTAFWIAALYHFNCWLHLVGRTTTEAENPNPGLHRYAHLIGAGLATGAALASKFSGVILLPCMLLLIAVELGRSGSRKVALRDGWITVAVLGALSIFVLQLSYLDLNPARYLKDLQQVNADHDPTYEYYLLGAFKSGGWRHYFAVTLLVKLPLALSLLALWGIWRTLRQRVNRNDLYLALPAVALFVATSLKADNLGIRYLMPMLPWFFVLAAGGVVELLRLPHIVGDPLRRAGVAALALALVAVPSLRSHPDQLAFFNVIAGGSSNGHRWLDDSNLDWGQDLKRLAAWMEERGLEQIKLRVQPNSSPMSYGIQARPITDTEWAHQRAPGYYAMSRHLLLRGERYHQRDPSLGTDWLTRYKPVAKIGQSIYVYRF